jgi:cystathionine beta-lyase/cystathionine gamma-synthase
MPTKSASKWSDATRAIHSGEPRHGLNVPVTTPIARTSNFNFADTAELKRWAEGKSAAYIYSRYGNPTLAAAEAKIAALENAEAALVTASGTAAISSALLAALQAGDEVIATRQIYGGSFSFFRDTLPRMGIRTQFVESTLDGLERLVNPKTRVLYVESPANPTLQIVDLKKAAALARKHKLTSMVDSTFGSPVLQKPLDLGFDLVLHSATKYLAGHSDIVAGAVAGSKAWLGKVREMMIRLGGSGRGLSADPRIEDPGVARAAAVPHGAGTGAVPGAPTENRAGALSGIGIASRSPAGAPANARRFRRNAGD